MTSNRWHAARSLFIDACNLPPDQRQSFLESRTTDPDLRREVLLLLANHHSSTSFLNSPISPDQPSALSIDPMIGRQLGDFIIVRRIGAGGMGVVYEARQLTPPRTAAVKILRPALVTPHALRRLEFESEILARLDHPSIARVFASGAFDAGDGRQPWFAMELIHGPNLAQFIADSAPSTLARLQLFLQLCDAVHHAHLRGVIHRDLKPSNILISSARVDSTSQPPPHVLLSDLAPLSSSAFVPKILDFGVARALDADPALSMHTLAGDVLGTLQYMSPEQLRGEHHLIDPRTDVYALGVIGFQLLAGKLPHDRQSSALEILRSIDRELPSRLGAIDPQFRGDLETIFAKALHPDPRIRYPSAADLASDIRRHLAHLPILARPATPLYLCSRFLRRNRALALGAAASFLALSVGLFLYAREARVAREEARRVRYEADKASAINNFITNDFLMKVLTAASAAAPDSRFDPLPLVHSAAAGIQSQFASSPLHEAAIRNEVGTIYYNLGDFSGAHQQFARALDLWESHLGPVHSDTLKAVNNLGLASSHLQQHQHALDLFRRALTGRSAALGTHHPDTLSTMNNLAAALMSAGHLDEAESLYRSAIDGLSRSVGPADKTTLAAKANLGTLLLQTSRADESARLHREVYDASVQSLGTDHPSTLSAGSRLAQTLLKNNNPDQALALNSPVLDGFLRTLGESHPSTIISRRLQARILLALDRPDDARHHLQLALQAARDQNGSDDALAAKIQKELDKLPSPATLPP